MENTFISQELEEMRSQISILKDKLEKQTIVNGTHIRNSMKSKASDMSRIIKRTVIVGVFAAIYCPIGFFYLGCSVPFLIVTELILAVSLIMTIRQNVMLGKVDFSQGSLIDIAETLGCIRKHYVNWTRMVAPMIILPWFAWTMYELGSSRDVAHGIALCVGGAIGGVIGGIIGVSINRKVVRKADEILSQVSELQEDN